MGAKHLLVCRGVGRLRLTKKVHETLPDDCGEVLCFGGSGKSVCCAVDCDQLGAGGYQLDGSLQFRDGAEGIFGAAHQERWRPELRKVSGTQLSGLSWRMERIGEQKKSVDCVGLGCGEEGGLAASVGAASEEGTPGELVPH